MHIVTLSPDEFLASLPVGVREPMTEIDGTIAAVMAGLERVLWQGVFWGGTEQSIIGYGTTTYERRGVESRWFMIGLAAQKAHLSVYVNAVDDGEYLSRRWADRLGKVNVGAASIGFRTPDDLDREAFSDFLIRARQLMD